MKRTSAFFIAVAALGAACSNDKPNTCGDGVVQEVNEGCDGTDLNGVTCETLGFATGTLACDDQCRFVTTECVAGQCGNDIREGNESCDGTDIPAGDTCVTNYYTGGTIACGDDCRSFDTSACTIECTAINGLGALPINEQVDVCADGTWVWDGGDCVGGAGGREVLYEITLLAGDSVVVTYTPAADIDAALYVLTDCLDTAGSTSCEDAADAGAAGAAETVTLTNASLNAITYFLVLDQWDTFPCGMGTLSVVAN